MATSSKKPLLWMVLSGRSEEMPSTIRLACASTAICSATTGSRSSSARMSGDELAAGIHGAAIVICNDYEFELIRQKTGLDETGVLSRAGALVITKGENGCTVLQGSTSIDVPAVTPESTALAKELKRRGFRFVGPTTAYATMQACGLVNDHLEGCRVRAEVEALSSAAHG